MTETNNNAGHSPEDRIATLEMELSFMQAMFKSLYETMERRVTCLERQLNGVSSAKKSCGN